MRAKSSQYFPTQNTYIVRPLLLLMSFNSFTVSYKITFKSIDKFNQEQSLVKEVSLNMMICMRVKCVIANNISEESGS